MGGAGWRRFRIPGWIKTLKVKAQECSGLEDVRKAVGMARIGADPLRASKRCEWVLVGIGSPITSKVPSAGCTEECENAHEGCRETAVLAPHGERRWDRW